MQYLELPAIVISTLAGIFLVLQIIGEIIEFKGKTAPEILKIRKYFKRRKKERMALSKISDWFDNYNQMSETIEKTKQILEDFDTHYSKDNIANRDKWMTEVNKHITDSEEIRKKQDTLMVELGKKLDKNNADTLDLLIDGKRDKIIDFANRVADERYPVTHEQFKRVFKLHDEYEKIIKENNMTNGEVKIAYRIIEDSYKKHMENHSFIEDIRGYNN
jgi:hypothetical protein